MEANECRVYFKAAEVETRLAELGLLIEDLTTAITAGDTSAAACTENDPRVLKNFTRWGKTFRGLADHMARPDRPRSLIRGWHKVERRCLPLMVTADAKTAITVSSADGRTGREGPFPRTLNPKGRQTKEAVFENQHTIPGMKNLVTQLRRVEDRQMTWFLLYHVDREDEVIHAELSFAAGFDPEKTKTIAEWYERILLPEMPLSTPALAEDEGEDDIDIIIEPKG
jgi:hypothetical protein